MAKFTLTIADLTAAELDEVTRALGLELGGALLERVEVKPEFS